MDKYGNYTLGVQTPRVLFNSCRWRKDYLMACNLLIAINNW
jgi:hypothetical protein